MNNCASLATIAQTKDSFVNCVDGVLAYVPAVESEVVSLIKRLKSLTLRIQIIDLERRSL